MSRSKSKGIQSQGRSGRPNADASVDVRATILEVAEAQFASQGYAATPIREIARAAGVNAAMVHYYFGNKESLLKAVLERALEPLARAIEAMKSAGSVSPDKVIRTLMATVAQHPRLPYLVLREVMLPGGVMQAHFARHLAPRLGGALPGIVKHEQANGRIRQDVQPATGALVIMSLAIFPFIVRPVAEQALDLDLHGEALESFREQVSAIVQRGFAP
ncbi:MAG: TetR/AcrR family transcriptional regulator [Xanthomonadales bacterium]|nr:TetR/AcrR family transcriptional regulator [Xanthomonadales bacterium]